MSKTNKTDSIHCYHGDTYTTPDGYTSSQYFNPGLSKLEMAVIHLMSASVTANDHDNPDWMDEEKAKQHAKSAIMLAKALFEELESETEK